MYSKIAVENVKKSFKDYSIYFLTITLAVCIFYSFNSIESQKSFIKLKSSDKEYINMLTQTLSSISIFVSIILGSLILYANNFLIKKRKKELGIYMTLGMKKNKISKILIIETFIVGIISLVSGILLGFIVSQGLSVFVGQLFAINSKDYIFVISISSILKTIIYFGIMFLLVMIFNTIIISKYKIIDLLYSCEKHENMIFKNPITYIILFILSLVSIFFAYKNILTFDFYQINENALISVILGIIGTVLFFFSLSGFLLYILKKNKKIYFKELNIFIIKQINSKVNTNFMSISIICLMLFFTILILSSGISYKSSLELERESLAPFDASAYVIIDKDYNYKDIKECLSLFGIKLDNGEKYVCYNEYTSPDITINGVLNKKISDKNKNKLLKYKNLESKIIKISEYNKIRKLQNKQPIKLQNNEVLILSNNGNMVDVVNDFLENNDDVYIKNKKYFIKNKKAIEDVIKVDYIKDNYLTLVVNDNLTDDFKAISSNININYSIKNKEALEEKLSKLFKDYKSGNIKNNNSSFILGYTKYDAYSENKGMTSIILFIGIYLGIIFLIASMAVLALQQLSEASDSLERYKALKRIGVNDKMINKTIFIQTLIYFSLPVILAFIHSIIGIIVVNRFISMYAKINILISQLLTISIFFIIYSGYFYATYTGYKNIIKNK